MSEVTPGRRWRRRLWRGIAFVLLTSLGLAAAGAVYVDPNRNRARIEAFLLNRTGLAIELGTIEWGLWPNLHASMDEAHVTTASWRAEIREFAAEGDLGELLRRRVRIEQIQAASIILELPDEPSDWLDVYRDVAEGVRPSKDAKKTGFKITGIGPIVVDYAELHSNDFTNAIIAANVSVSDVMAPEIVISANGTSPAGGTDSRFRATASLTRVRGEGLKRISGEGVVEGVNMHGLFPEFPPTRVSLNLKTISEVPDRIGVEIKGTTLDAEHPALNGTLGAAFWYTPEAIRFDDIRYDAPEAVVHAKVNRSRAGEIEAEITEVSLKGSALDAFLDQVRREPVHLAAADGASVSISNVLFGLRADGTQEFTRGAIDFSGLSILDPSGHAYETDIRGRGIMEGRVISVDQFEGDHSNFTATFEPNFDNATVTYKGSGTIRVTEDLLPARVRERYVPQASLPIRIDSLDGSFTRGDRPGRKLSFAATVGEGNVGLAFADVDTLVSSHGGTLRFDDGLLDIALELESEEFGPIAAAGRYDIDDRSVIGTINCDVPTVLPNFIKGAGPDSMYASILQQFGTTTVGVKTTIPKSSTDTVTVAFQHDEEPRANASIAFARVEDAGLRLGDMSATGTLDAAALDPRVSGPFLVKGPLSVVFERNAAKETFEVQVDAAQASARFGRRVEKRPGDPLSVLVAGTAPKSKWRADRLEVTCFGQRVPIQFVEGGLACEPVQIDLAKLTRIAPEGGYLSGSATLGFNTVEDTFYFGFENASFELEDELGLDALDGVVRVVGDTIGESNLRLQNDAGDCTVTWAMAEDGWRGTANGAYLDVDVLLRILNGIRQASGNETPIVEQPAGGPSRFPLDGAIEVRLDRVKYRNALFTDVVAVGTSTAESMRFPAIRAAAYGGIIDGSAVLQAGSPGAVRLALTFTDVDMALLDDLYFKGERDFYGAASGRLAFSSPVGTIQQMLAAGSGSGSMTAANGGFGKAGWATRFLAVLRTVEIFALRMPTLKDEGLTYDTCAAGFTMTDGTVTLSDASLESPAYKMDAAGSMSFASDATDIDVNVYLFQSVNRVTQHIPLIRNVADLTTGRIAVRVDVTGPPSSLRFSVPADAGIIQNVVGIGNRSGQPR